MSIYDNEAAQAAYYREQQKAAEPASSLHTCPGQCNICWAESYDDNPAYCAPSDEDK